MLEYLISIIWGDRVLMKNKYFFAVSISLTMVACTISAPETKQVQNILNPTIQTHQLSTQEMFKPGKALVQSEGDKEKVTFTFNPEESFKTQNVTPANLKFIKLSLRGSGIAGTLTNDGGVFIPVTGGTVTASISNVPLSAGNLRVVSVQGYDANQAILPAFVGKGFYKSSAGTTTVSITISRRFLLAGQVLEQLIAEGNPLANTLNTSTLQTQLETATGFNSTTNTFTTDPTRFNVTNLVNLVKNGGGSVTSAQVTAGATANPVNVTVHFKTPAGGPLNEAITIQIDDPDSTPQTINANTASPTIVILNVNPGTWNVRAKKADGTVVASTSVTVTTAGTFTLVAGSSVPTALSLAGVTEVAAPCVGVNCNITLIAGTPGVSGTTGDGGPATAATMENLWGAAVDSIGNVYVNNEVNHTIRKIDTAGNVSTIAGVPGSSGSTGEGGPASLALLNFPHRLIFDSAGLLYFTDAGNGAIRRINSDGNIQTVVGTHGTQGSTGDGGQATAARIQSPSSITFDNLGNLYFTQNSGAASVVRKVDTAGIITTVAGTASGSTGDGGPITAARMFAPIDLVVDNVGTIYVLEQGNCVLRKFDTAADITSTIAGQMCSCAVGVDGPATASSLNFPNGLGIDVAGNLYIADSSNRAIRKLGSDGNLSTFAGTLNSSGTQGDGGPATAARLNLPMDVVFDAQGNLYIPDRLAHTVRKVGP